VAGLGMDNNKIVVFLRKEDVPLSKIDEIFQGVSYDTRVIKMNNGCNKSMEEIMEGFKNQYHAGREEREKPEILELGPVTQEDIDHVREVNPIVSFEDLPKIKDLNNNQVIDALELSEDLAAMIHHDKLDLVLENVKKRLEYTKPLLAVSWESGRLALNGVRVKLRMGEAKKAIETLTKFCSHDRASEIIAELWVEKIKELV
jgi:hypothetical protein